MPDNITDRDLLFAILGGVCAYLSVCILIWPIAGCMARYSFKRGPRLARIEAPRTEPDHHKERNDDQ